jgi:hypothetical protein
MKLFWPTIKLPALVKQDKESQTRKERHKPITKFFYHEKSKCKVRQRKRNAD